MKETVSPDLNELPGLFKTRLVGITEIISTENSWDSEASKSDAPSKEAKISKTPSTSSSETTQSMLK